MLRGCTRHMSTWRRLSQRLRGSDAMRNGPPRPIPQPMVAGTYHGVQRVDEFAWLHRTEQPEVEKYLLDENRYTKSFMADTLAFQDKLYEEMAAHVDAAEESVEERVDDYLYYSRTAAGESMPVYCRRGVGSIGSSGEEVLLDHNAILREHGYVSVGVVKLSHDHAWLAYTVDTSGDDTYDAVVVKLGGGRAGEVRRVPNVVGVEWASDGETIFYTTADSHGRPFRVYRQRVHSTEAELLYEESDERFYMDVSRTKDKKFITINANCKTCSEVRVVSAYAPFSSVRLVQAREEGIEYFVDHCGDDFLIVTNDGAQNYKIVRAADSQPSRSQWSDFYVPPQGHVIEDMDIFQAHCVIYERSSLGLPQVTVLDASTRGTHTIPLPTALCALRPGANATFNSATVRLTLAGPVTPEYTIDYDMATRKMHVLRHRTVQGMSTEDFEVRQLMAPGGDVEVPITVVHRRDVQLNGCNPLLLHGYGAYGHNIEADFAPERLPLFARGWVYALCHVRGGAERGKPWHADGRMMNKRNSFSDFAACARHLHATGYSMPALTAARGASAGGLLVAATCLEHPGLIASAVLRVPFVDVLTAMLDPTLPLTVHEYDEWGNPLADADVHRYITSYCPYQNLGDKGPGVLGSLPNMMLTASMNDARVPAWQPAKFVARIRDMSAAAAAKGTGKDSHPITLLHTDWDGGHFGSGGRLAYLRDYAHEYAFLHKTLRLLVPAA